MRFVSFAKNGLDTAGVELGEDLVDLSVAAPHLPRNLLQLIQGGLLREAHDAAKRADAEALVDRDTVNWLPLLSRPPKIFGFGVNYGSHVGERPACPGFFIASPTRLAAHNEAIIIPSDCPTLDYEVELAVVIGRGGSGIAAADALDHVAGYSIFNDASVRAYGVGERLALMKNCDKTAPFGPVLVTAEELPPGAAGLRLRTSRNGVEVQNDTTDSMFWNVREIVEVVSSYMTLQPGDVITTGTPGGTMVEVAFAAGRSFSDPATDWLKPGDKVVCEIEGIGAIANTVVSDN